MEKFNDTELHVLRQRYSRQRIEYWEHRGYVPTHLLRTVSGMIGRKLDELLPEEKTMRDTDK
ncbi:MAG: hypothetical protein NUV51_05575 [Sulfuricaulis sp.]|nr:hypothetical protein [Sulfuricaulis sp.]